ncbi:MAG: hypothetical protein KJO49_06190, partial [Bacteroidia bacterium]|nr:hypothetical protein [Bacteroidia bacterium]
MAKFLLRNLLLFIGLSLVSVPGFSQTEWTGPTMTFTKIDFADWTLPANQDMLTANVILTRADNRGLFNIVLETEFDNAGFTSPLDTEWAIGSISDG